MKKSKLKRKVKKLEKDYEALLERIQETMEVIASCINEQDEKIEILEEILEAEEA